MKLAALSSQANLKSASANRKGAVSAAAATATDAKAAANIRAARVNA